MGGQGGRRLAWRPNNAEKVNRSEPPLGAGSGYAGHQARVLEEFDSRVELSWARNIIRGKKS